MIITVTTGMGVGTTLLSAFDNALKDAGVLSYNLLYLSSIIPPHSCIERAKLHAPATDYGKRLYLVKAEQRSTERGKYVGAGIGWYQLDDGRGVFVEHESTGETLGHTEFNLERDIFDSLTELCAHREWPIHKSRIHMITRCTQVDNSPTCVLALAVYQSVSWAI